MKRKPIPLVCSNDGEPCLCNPERVPCSCVQSSEKYKSHTCGKCGAWIFPRRADAITEAM